MLHRSGEDLEERNFIPKKNSETSRKSQVMSFKAFDQKSDILISDILFELSEEDSRTISL